MPTPQEEATTKKAQCETNRTASGTTRDTQTTTYNTDNSRYLTDVTAYTAKNWSGHQQQQQQCLQALNTANGYLNTQATKIGIPTPGGDYSANAQIALYDHDKPLGDTEFNGGHWGQAIMYYNGCLTELTNADQACSDAQSAHTSFLTPIAVAESLI